METTDFGEIYKSWGADKRQAFADAVGTSTEYIEIHYLAPKHRRKTPRPGRVNRMLEALGGRLTKLQLLSFFFGDEEESAA